MGFCVKQWFSKYVPWEHTASAPSVSPGSLLEMQVFGVGGGREVQEGGDICIPMADSCCCLQYNIVKHYPPVKNKFKKRNAGFQALFQTYGFRTSRRGGQPCVF